MEDIAKWLGYRLDKPIADNTGLTGIYDIDIILS
jgi:uncharacterized protein (TIGR03435 family)